MKIYRTFFAENGYFFMLETIEDAQTKHFAGKRKTSKDVFQFCDRSSLKVVVDNRFR